MDYKYFLVRIYPEILNISKPLTESNLDIKNLILSRYLFKLVKFQYPVDYLIGKINFQDFEVIINRGVFIPREETEWLILNLIQAKNTKENIFSKAIEVKLKNCRQLVEVGGGSGFIGLSLSKVFKKVFVMEKYLLPRKCIKKTLKNSVIFNYKLYNSDLFSNKLLKPKLKNLRNWLLIANLPYVPNSDLLNFKSSSIKWEPKTAIYSGYDGLFLFKRLLKQIKELELKPKIAVFELDPRNIYKAFKIAKKIFTKNYIYPDQQKKKRFLICII